jgi:hypothetical protein
VVSRYHSFARVGQGINAATPRDLLFTTGSGYYDPQIFNVPLTLIFTLVPGLPDLEITFGDQPPVMTRGQQSLFVNVFPGETIRIRSHRLGPQIGLSWIPDESGMNAHELRASSWKTGMLFGGSIGSSGTPPRSRSVAPAFTEVARI